MRKIFSVICPKEEDKRYFSKAKHKYSNNINVYVNGALKFENINDAEENLPCNKQGVIDLLDDLPSTILLDYDITMDKTKEKCSVEFVLNPMVDMIHTTIKRDNFLEGSENLSDEYQVQLQVNDHVYNIGKEYHEGDTKLIKCNHNVDLNDIINIKLESKKVFKNSKEVTYDQIEVILI